MALAIIHFIRRRPDTYWLYIILFLGPLGAMVYLLVEAVPDVGLLRQSFKVFPTKAENSRTRSGGSRQSFGRELRRTGRPVHGRREDSQKARALL